MANRPGVLEGVVVFVGWGAYAFIMEFREALINKNPKKRRSDSTNGIKASIKEES